MNDTSFKPVYVTFGLGPDSAPIEISGVQVGGILKKFTFQAGQMMCHTVNLEIFCNKIEIKDHSVIVIDDVEIHDPNLARQICDVILEKYGKDIDMELGFNIPVETWRKLCELVKSGYFDPDDTVAKIEEILDSVTISDDAVFVRTPQFTVQYPMINGNDKDSTSAKQYLESLGFNR